LILWLATKVPAITQKWIPGLAAWFALRFKSKDQELAELRAELKAQQGKNTEILEAQLIEAKEEIEFWRDKALRALNDDAPAVRREIRERVDRGSLPGVDMDEISEPVEDDDETVATE
jgi:recombinational DNA repair ATPase RecF